MATRARYLTTGQRVGHADVPLAAGYPSLRVAARMIGVHPSTLSRQQELRSIPAGRERRLPAAEVLRLAATYQKRSLAEVAGALVEQAGRQAGREVQEAVGIEVDEFLEQSPTPGTPVDLDAFLAEAHRYLPGGLAAEVEKHVRGRRDVATGSVGWSPGTD